MKHKHLAAAALVLGLIVLFQYSREANSDIGLLRPEDKKIVSLGKELYAEHCASCHGVGLEGEKNWKQPKPDGRMPAPPHDETGHTWHHPDKQLFDITKYGIAALMKLDNYQTDMPVYEDVLSDHEIIAVLSYIKAQWPSEIRNRHDEMNRQQGGE